MLARKISRAKWEPKGYLGDDEIRADAVTGCLRTSDDALSWWRCADDEQDVAEVALALAMPVEIGKQKIDKIDVVLLQDADLVGLGLSLNPTVGIAIVDDLRSRHVDVVYFDLERLARLARLLAPRIRSETKVFTFTRSQVKALLKAALDKNRFKEDKLNEEVRSELRGNPSSPA